jgi:hypothetical protein
MIPAWLAVPLYLGVIFFLLYAGDKASSLWHARKLRAKAEHDDLMRRANVKSRMYVMPREPEKRRAASP